MAAPPIQVPDGKHVVITGPVSGSVEVDGRSYDVSPPHVFVDSHEEALAVAAATSDLHRDQFPGHYAAPAADQPAEV